MNSLFKLTIALIFWLLFVLYANAQGYVTFSNSTGPICSQVFGADQVTPLEGDRHLAQLWYRMAGTSDPFIPHPETLAFEAGAAAGFYKERITQLPDIPGGSTIDAQVRVWDTQSGDSWETATVRFSSNIVQTIAETPSPPPGRLEGLEFTSLQIHPETNGYSFTWPNQQLCEKTYQLEWAEEIAGPWSAVEEPAELINGRWQATIENPESSTGYFRLRLLE